MVTVTTTLARDQCLLGTADREWEQVAARQVREDSGGPDLGQGLDCQTQEAIIITHYRNSYAIMAITQTASTCIRPF